MIILKHILKLYFRPVIFHIKSASFDLSHEILHNYLIGSCHVGFIDLMMWRGFCIINKVFGCRIVSCGSCTIISSTELDNLFRWTFRCLSIISIKVTHLVQYKTVGEGETQLRIWIWPLYSAVTFPQNKSSSLWLNGFNAFLWPNQRRSYTYTKNIYTLGKFSCLIHVK